MITTELTTTTFYLLKSNEPLYLIHQFVFLAPLTLHATYSLTKCRERERESCLGGGFVQVWGAMHLSLNKRKSVIVCPSKILLRAGYLYVLSDILWALGRVAPYDIWHLGQNGDGRLFLNSWGVWTSSNQCVHLACKSPTFCSRMVWLDIIVSYGINPRMVSAQWGSCECVTDTWPYWSKIEWSKLEIEWTKHACTSVLDYFFTCTALQFALTLQT